LDVFEVLSGDDGLRSGAGTAEVITNTTRCAIAILPIYRTDTIAEWQPVDYVQHQVDRDRGIGWNHE
jgi:hypothetical protein